MWRHLALKDPCHLLIISVPWCALPSPLSQSLAPINDHLSPLLPCCQIVATCPKELCGLVPLQAPSTIEQLLAASGMPSLMDALDDTPVLSGAFSLSSMLSTLATEVCELAPIHTVGTLKGTAAPSSMSLASCKTARGLLPDNAQDSQYYLLATSSQSGTRKICALLRPCNTAGNIYIFGFEGDNEDD